MTIILFLFFLSLLIIAHELGHFLVARKLGLKVEEFALGLPPKIFSIKSKETEYSIGALLFGGYVKLKGENDPKDKDGFLYASPGKKFFITIAGIVFNVILAYLILSFSLLGGYPIAGEKIFVSGFLKKNSLANQKFNVGDEILAIKFQNEIFNFSSASELADFLHKNKGKEMIVIFSRQGKILEEKVQPPVGFYLANFTLKKVDFPKNFLLAFSLTIENCQKIVEGFQKLIISWFKKEKINIEVVGPVGIYNLFENFKNFGWSYLFYFIAILSLNLAFINLLPFPALDGGRLVFILLEMIWGRRLAYEKEEIIHKIGFAFLFVFLLVITFKDISKLWGK